MSSDFDSSELNIHSRAKRNIHFQEVTQISSGSESEDEDFMPDESSTDNSQSESEHEIKDSVSVDEISSNNEKESIPIKMESLSKNDEEKKSIEKQVKAKKTKLNEPMALSNGEPAVKKKRKYTKKKLFVNQLSDEETQKFISSFKNSKIVKKEKKTPKVTKKMKLNLKTESLNKSETLIDSHSTAKKGTGPFVRSHRPKDSNYTMYIVHQSNSTHDAGNENVHKKFFFSKEKIPPIVDLDSPWICNLCHNKSKSLNGLGDLYGPYRISFVHAHQDLALEFKTEKNNEDAIENFKEIWLHEGCLIWTPNIYLIDNRLEGISEALESASKLKCFSCKKKGATLLCHKHGCGKIFHFPCAVANKAYFNKENFTIHCNKHRSKHD